MRTVSCAAPYGEGGLGHHLAQVVEEARAEGVLGRYYSAAPKSGDRAGTAVQPRAMRPLLERTPIRLRPDWRASVASELFDRTVASNLGLGDTFVGFSGQALRSFEVAQKLGYSTLVLESPTGHVLHVLRQQRLAERSEIERGWLGRRQLERALREYDVAGAITVTSGYARETFIANGVSAEKLRLRRLRVHPRFIADRRRSGRDGFRILYVGALTAMKGVHVLLDAFSSLSGNVELTLVGGWATRAMRRFVGERLRADLRVRLAVGDPFPHFQRADVYVHPSFHDGFGLAPMEALACGVPVIVTEDTGMREHVEEGVNGHIVPTGDVEALVRRLDLMRVSGLARNPSGGVKPLRNG